MPAPSPFGDSVSSHSLPEKVAEKKESVIYRGVAKRSKALVFDTSIFISSNLITPAKETNISYLKME